MQKYLLKNLIKKLYLKLFIIYLNIKIIYLFNIFYILIADRKEVL